MIAPSLIEGNRVSTVKFSHAGSQPPITGIQAYLEGGNDTGPVLRGTVLTQLCLSLNALYRYFKGNNPFGQSLHIVFRHSAQEPWVIEAAFLAVYQLAQMTNRVAGLFHQDRLAGTMDGNIVPGRDIVVAWFVPTRRNVGMGTGKYYKDRDLAIERPPLWIGARHMNKQGAVGSMLRIEQERQVCGQEFSVHLSNEQAKIIVFNHRMEDVEPLLFEIVWSIQGLLQMLLRAKSAVI
jgi:hypothetical protein